MLRHSFVPQGAAVAFISFVSLTRKIQAVDKSGLHSSSARWLRPSADSAQSHYVCTYVHALRLATSQLKRELVPLPSGLSALSSEGHPRRMGFILCALERRAEGSQSPDRDWSLQMALNVFRVSWPQPFIASQEMAICWIRALR